MGGYTPGIQIIDVQQAAQPTRIARCGIGRAYAVRGQGDYLYVGTGANYPLSEFRGLQVMDVSDLWNPISVASCETDSSLLEVALNGPYLFASAHDSGVLVFDVSNPAGPQIIAEYTGIRTFALDVAGDYVYVTDFDGRLLVFEWTGEALEYRGETGILPSWDICARWPYVYVAAAPALHIIDVSNPTQPVEVGQYFHSWDGPYSVVVVGDYAYTATGENVRVLDIANPLEPAVVAVYATHQWPQDVSVAGGYVYVADDEGGLAVLEVHRPGDLNCDGYVDAFDVDPFVEALVAPDAYAEAQPWCHDTNADMNGDGAVDAFDIDPFVELLTGR